MLDTRLMSIESLIISTFYQLLVVLPAENTLSSLWLVSQLISLSGLCHFYLRWSPIRLFIFSSFLNPHFLLGCPILVLACFPLWEDICFRTTIWEEINFFLLRGENSSSWCRRLSWHGWCIHNIWSINISIFLPIPSSAYQSRTIVVVTTSWSVVESNRWSVFICAFKWFELFVWGGKPHCCTID